MASLCNGTYYVDGGSGVRVQPVHVNQGLVCDNRYFLGRRLLLTSDCEVSERVLVDDMATPISPEGARYHLNIITIRYGGDDGRGGLTVATLPLLPLGPDAESTTTWCLRQPAGTFRVAVMKMAITNEPEVRAFLGLGASEAAAYLTLIPPPQPQDNMMFLRVNFGHGNLLSIPLTRGHPFP